LLLMKADDSFIGAMSMIAVAANMLQFLAPLLLERFPRRKKMILALRGAMLFANILFIGIIPLFPVDNQIRLNMIAVTVLCANLLSALISPGISIWHMQSIPPNVRAGFFTVITMTAGVVVAVFNLAGSAIVDAFKARGSEYWGLLSLRVMAMIIAAFDMYLYSRVKEYPYECDNPVKPDYSVRDLIVKPFKEKLYLRTVAVAFLWSFAANISGPYYMMYMLENMGVDYSFIMLVSFMNVPIVLFFTPVWRNLLTRFDWFKTLYVAIALYLFYLVSLAFVTKGTLWLYAVSLVWAYLMSIGINLSFSGIPYVNMPEKHQTVFIGFYSTMANAAAFLGVTLGRYFIIWSNGVTINILGVQMINRQFIMLLMAAAMALASAGIWRIHKSMPKSD